MFRLQISSVSDAPYAQGDAEIVGIVAKWLGRQSYLDDLESLDADLYKGLISGYNMLSGEY